MYLKRLDIQGFKSFPDKLKLEFNQGITAVVGPNGSGKSNISDAVRWVLGEQSAKTLRGSKMEDIIFTGTANRKALGFAEVSITLDNEDRTIPLDYSEINVTRRVYRSGESEYVLNGTNCRLKDVYELFTDTGIGKEGYSIIGQGRIDEILSTKSEDRRNMFEEAAGILKYKNRREEAKAKLEREHMNLSRVEDIISTLEEQVAPLKIQAEKAQTYFNLKERLKIADINIFLSEAEKHEKDLDDIVKKSEILQTQYVEENTEYDNLKSLYQERKAKVEEISIELQDLQKAFYDIDADINKNESNINSTQQQISYMLQDTNRLQIDIERKTEQLNQFEQSKEIFTSKTNEAAKNMVIQCNVLEEKQTRLRELTDSLNESESLVENYNSEILEKIRKTSNIKADIQSSDSMFAQLHKRAEQIEKESRYNLSVINDKKVRIQALEKAKDENEQIEKDISQMLTETEQEKEKAQKKLQDEKKQLDELNVSMSRKKGEYKFLKNTQKEHMGFAGSVKAILKAKEENSNEWSGIHGVIGELIHVPQKYELAIEIALGQAVNNIVTQSETEAKKAIEFLKRTNSGRATFLPLSSISARYVGTEKDNLLSEKGVLGIASDIIEYDKTYDNVFKNLLGRVFVVDTLDNAIIFSKKHNYMYRIVTLEGEILSGGALTGGSKSQNSTNIFSRARELTELENNLSELARNLNEKNESIEVLEESISEYEEFISEKKQEYQENHMQILSLYQQITQTAELVKEIEQKQAELDIENIQSKEQIKNTEEMQAEYKEMLLLLETEIESTQKKLDAYQSSIMSDKLSKEGILNQITEARVSISTFEQEKKACEDNLARLSEDIERLKEEIRVNKQEIENLKQNQELGKENIKDIENVIIKYREGKKEKQEQIHNLEQYKRDVTSESESIEKKTEEQRTKISLLEQETIRIEAMKDKLAENKKVLYDNIWNEYEMTLVSAKQYKQEDISYSQLQRESRELKNAIKELGNVNMEAIQEYKNVSERYDFLTTQRNDIISAEEKLQGIITELTELMSNQFLENFELISKNFQEVFVEMFGGGKAYLQLSDSSNILESGIDIIAQPPGKVLQNMMLLSGGERALTAIALLFAILLIKPSPFCILDEIEAALDDANVNRYAEYLRKLSRVTQFIVVTHRKGTMAAADILYGVTMQEQGVSKLVSVKLEEAAI